MLRNSRKTTVIKHRIQRDQGRAMAVTLQGEEVEQAEEEIGTEEDGTTTSRVHCTTPHTRVKKGDKI